MGAISVTANVVPADAAGMFDAFFAGKMEEALKFHYKMEPLHGSMFIETNPIPVKTSLALMGKITRGVPPAALSYGRREQGEAQEGAEGLRADLDSKPFTTEDAESIRQRAVGLTLCATRSAPVRNQLYSALSGKQ